MREAGQTRVAQKSSMPPQALREKWRNIVYNNADKLRRDVSLVADRSNRPKLS
ncbi:hypothetical protein [Vannielia litorea]|uniref:hypothetical protein n=1 Tax=Vannielia litorea TaxID=1217970 RepID=UPI001BCD1558|nr:hypothetical protein [Vannielia litorea]